MRLKSVIKTQNRNGGPTGEPAELHYHIPEISGPARKRIGDAMAVQTRALAAALETSIEIPERDLVVLNRP